MKHLIFIIVSTMCIIILWPLSAWPLAQIAIGLNILSVAASVAAIFVKQEDKK